MRKFFANTYDKICGALFILLYGSPVFAGVGDWIATDENWTTYIKSGIKFAQGIAIALGILAGIKLFTAWMSGSEEGGRDKGALIKWGIGFFIIIVFFAFITFFEKSILGS